MNLKLKVLAESSAPGMIRILSVGEVIGNTVNSVTLKEAGVLARYEIRDCVREILRHVMPIVGIERNYTLTVNLCLRGLGNGYSMAISRKSLGGIACRPFIPKGDRKLKASVGDVNY
jgi:hypothetical protein